MLIRDEFLLRSQKRLEEFLVVFPWNAKDAASRAVEGKMRDFNPALLCIQVELFRVAHDGICHGKKTDDQALVGESHRGRVLLRNPLSLLLLHDETLSLSHYAETI